MNKVMDICIGHINFIIDENAYLKLKNYLKQFESTITCQDEVDKIMEDVEARIAEIFTSEIKFTGQVIDIRLVDEVIERFGVFEANTEEPKKEQNYSGKRKRLFRDVDRRNFAGVCSGLSYYMNIDVSVIRVFFVIFNFFYGCTSLIYILLWIAIPKAKTATQKLIMRGIAPTAENIRLQNRNKA